MFFFMSFITMNLEYIMLSSSCSRRHRVWWIIIFSFCTPKIDIGVVITCRGWLKKSNRLTILLCHLNCDYHYMIFFYHERKLKLIHASVHASCCWNYCMTMVNNLALLLFSFSRSYHTANNNAGPKSCARKL